MQKKFCYFFKFYFMLNLQISMDILVLYKVIPILFGMIIIFIALLEFSHQFKKTNISILENLNRVSRFKGLLDTNFNNYKQIIMNGVKNSK